MTATVLSRVVDRIDAVLQAALAGHSQVWRDRADAVCIDEAPGVNVLPRQGNSTPFSAELDTDELELELRFYVRAEGGTPAVEALHKLAHDALYADAQLLALVDSIRRLGSTFDHHPADTTSVIKSVNYRLLYQTPTKTL
ncbi:MAG: hypothetical protein SHS37scaffold296_5 [Burkholderiales phage 68_11]|jgi:hypothetical protein|nr:MAG: hypothetical protein SHS37scaffold296_5 [Burkholderiales phage 68_11]